jgi:hypothetical protein
MKKKERIKQLTELYQDACERVDEYRTDLDSWQDKYHKLALVTTLISFVAIFFIAREIIKHF